MILSDRVRTLAQRENPPKARYVLYWMQRSQRAIDNPALEFAIQRANQMALPLLVGFGLMDDYPEANERHYAFMLEGLRETVSRLRRRGILMVIRHGATDAVAIDLAKEAALLVCDRGYLRHEKAWRRHVAASAACSVIEIEADLAVPADLASDKAEIAARTFRPKILRHLGVVPEEWREVPVQASLSLGIGDALDLENVPALLRRLRLDRSVGTVTRFRGGTSAGLHHLERFIEAELGHYREMRGEPGAGAVSHLSPYLHFGQISVMTVLRSLRDAQAPVPSRDSFIDEIVVRRELAVNFVEHTQDYDRFAAMPDWARRSLAAHRRDPRPALYSPQQLEMAETDDPYWNAAMTEMRLTGYMHNRMRMYWGKRVLAWTREPEDAYHSVLTLNNRWLLDGRDPNSFANVGWIFGLHDRPWPEQPIFGAVRSMTAGGLRRKCDIDAYLAAVARLS